MENTRQGMELAQVLANHGEEFLSKISCVPSRSKLSMPSSLAVHRCWAGMHQYAILVGTRSRLIIHVATGTVQSASS